ncbi:MAG: hypothetical protein JW866_08185, partial [Ignavibacteriales bacterium]|nr:hypothetical protein [Ignavibacteriales bacterium]
GKMFKFFFGTSLFSNKIFQGNIQDKSVQQNPETIEFLTQVLEKKLRIISNLQFQIFYYNSNLWEIYKV